MRTFDEVRGQLGQRTEEVGIPQNTAQARELHDAYVQAAVAVSDVKEQLRLRPDNEFLLNQLEQAEAAEAETMEDLRPHLVVFVFEALPGEEFEKLLDRDEHRPTKKQRADFLKRHPEMRSGPQFNTETFPPVLLSECSVDPKMTIDEARELWGTLGEGDRNALLITALKANQGTEAVDLGKGSKTTRR